MRPGVTDLVLNPDAHCGYGVPGCAGLPHAHLSGPGGCRHQVLDELCSLTCRRKQSMTARPAAR